MNRYQKAAIALKWKEANNTSYQEAATEFGLTNKRVISNLKHMRNVRPDLYPLIEAGTLSYTTAYKLFKANASIDTLTRSRA